MDGGFAAAATAATISFAHNNSQAGAQPVIVNGTAGFSYPHHNLTGAYIFTGAATGFLFASIVTLVKAAKHGRKALRLYNQRFE